MRWCCWLGSLMSFKRKCCSKLLKLSFSFDILEWLLFYFALVGRQWWWHSNNIQLRKIANYLVWCTETVTRFKSYLVVLLKRVLLFYTFKFLRLCLTSYVLNLLSSMLWLCTYYSIIIHNSWMNCKMNRLWNFSTMNSLL